MDDLLILQVLETVLVNQQEIMRSIGSNGRFGMSLDEARDKTNDTLRLLRSATRQC